MPIAYKVVYKKREHIMHFSFAIGFEMCIIKILVVTLMYKFTKVSFLVN